jgi:hypothetical protein
MGIFRKAEKKLEGLVEGGFGRAFKASVQPVELAHKLAKEMGDHKTVGVSNVYVPNEFDIFLGEADYGHLSSLSESLKVELANYVTAVARREGWTLVAPPRIDLHRDDDLRVGEFGIATRTVNAPAEVPGAAFMPPAAAPQQAAAAPGPLLDHTVMYQEAAPALAPAAVPPVARASRASGSCARPSPSSDAAAAATSCSPTPTCRASTPRSDARTTASWRSTSGRPTACASTVATSSRPCCSTGTASNWAPRSSCSRGCRDAGLRVKAAVVLRGRAGCGRYS